MKIIVGNCFKTCPIAMGPIFVYSSLLQIKKHTDFLYIRSLLDKNLLKARTMYIAEMLTKFGLIYASNQNMWIKKVERIMKPLG